MELIPTRLPLEKKVTFQMSVPMDGTNGATTESTPTASHIIKTFWDGYWCLHEGKEMSWPSGSLRQMGMQYPNVPIILSR